MGRETPVNIGSLILSEPDFREGQPFIAGTRRSVESIAAMYRHGETPEEIAAALPEIPRAKIFAALTHYFANQAQIDCDLREDAELYRSMYAEAVARRAGSAAG